MNKLKYKIDIWLDRQQRELKRLNASVQKVPRGKAATSKKESRYKQPTELIRYHHEYDLLTRRNNLQLKLPATTNPVQNMALLSKSSNQVRHNMSIQLPLLSTLNNTTYTKHPTPLHCPAPAYQLWWCSSPNCGRANQPDKWYCGYCGLARATDRRKPSRFF